MAYIKNIWVDQDVERPKTYEVTNNQDGSITLTDSFGLVTELGTPVNEVNMNHIEEGIEGCAIRKHNLTETFDLGEWVLGGTGENESFYKSLIPNNVGNAITDDTAWEKVALGGGNGYEVNDLVWRLTPTEEAGKHLLDGTLLPYGIYKEYIDKIAELYNADPTANYFTDETTWQATVNTYGSCGKFVYDSVNNTVRLPKVSDILQCTTDLNAVGDLIEAGLPNVTGTFLLHGAQGSSDWTGAFYQDGTGGDWSYGHDRGSANPKVAFDASRSSSLYKNNFTTVQPQTIKGLLYIVIATSTKTDIQVDIDEIATDLNGKADVDLTNVTDTGYIKMAGAGMPSNRYINLTLGASGTQYTAPANGWFTLRGDGSSSYTHAFMTSVNNGLCSGYTTGSNGNANVHVWLAAQKGQKVQIDYSDISTLHWFRFVYAQGSESEAN